MDENHISLETYCRRLTNAIATASGLQNVWVTAELSDVRLNNTGHCYMELIEKNAFGADVAKLRAIVWRSTFPLLARKFETATGQKFASGLKVMVKLSASLHPVYGLSVVISDIDASFTLGDAVRRRNEILKRLTDEGVIGLNRELEFPAVPKRIAVISSPTAAGYEDFVNQLHNNPYKLGFQVSLFEALMQGENTVDSVINALSRVADSDRWDCVVIIRGGGATSDLLVFDNYELAASVAQFPIPVVVGIGHERDINVLDFVANKSVKTPTAAAEIFISCGKAALDELDALASLVAHKATAFVAGYREQLAHYQSSLPHLPAAFLQAADSRLLRLSSAVVSVKSTLESQRATLTSFAATLSMSAANLLSRRAADIDALQRLLNALSPEATLRRGYSITSIDGHAVTSINDVAQGAKVTTTLADGVFTSTAE